MSDRSNSIHALSLVHLDVVNLLKKLEFSFKIEEPIFGLDVDILLLDPWTKEICASIEIHGV